jgi:hypothetical protein
VYPQSKSRSLHTLKEAQRIEIQKIRIKEPDIWRAKLLKKREEARGEGEVSVVRLMGIKELTIKEFMTRGRTN